MKTRQSKRLHNLNVETTKPVHLHNNEETTMSKYLYYAGYVILAALTLFFCWMFCLRWGVFGAKVDWISRSKALIRRYQVYKGKNESGNQSINSASVNPTADPIASTSNASDSRHRILLFHDLEINQTVREVHKNGQLLDLTETEYSMLELLVANRHQTFSAQRLFESVWQEPYYYGANNTVTVHIRNLRSKVEDNPGNPELIKTVWGKGYRCD